MATWDGSFQTEDPTYSAENTWTYFDEGSARSYHHPGPGALYRINPQHPSNMVSFENAYQEHILPSSSSSNSYPVNGVVPASSGRNMPFYRDNYKPRSRGNRSKPISSEGDFVQSSIVQNSNLQATANEFVPNSVKSSKKDRFNKQENHYDNAVGGNSFDGQDFRPRSINKYTSSMDNRYKGERRYDNRRDVNYRQKNQQDAPPRSNYRDQRSGNGGRNYNKFQNGKYYNRRHQSDTYMEQYVGKARTPTNEYGSPFTVDRQENKAFAKELQEADLSSDVGRNGGTSENNDSENASLKAHETQRNGKPKRFNDQANTSNYYKYNNYKYKHYYKQYNSDDVQSEPGGRKIASKSVAVTTKYTHKRNNEVTANYKEKNLENWRDRAEDNEAARVQGKSLKNKPKIDDDASQRERLTEQLNRGILECLVCYEHIKQSEYVWSCSNCYHVLHLKCIKKWAKSSQSENSWKCPACRDISLLVPEDYFCFCGKRKMPEWNRKDVAHSCGEICGRNLSKNNCTHKCTLLCHPGSCPQCVAMVTKYCGCGRTSKMLLCSAHELLQCDLICEKDLSCGKHTCQRKCHQGECESCDKTVQQTCFCGKKTQEVPCRANVTDTYSCNNICNKPLDCEKHYCQQICHLGACEPCSLTPERITTCCCGQTPLTEKRESCLDPVPTCDKICSKRLKCGQPSNPHICKAPCHVGDCPDCDLNTDVKCRCGNMDREIACKELTSKADDARCEKRCKKKRSCGKHNCNQLCCIDIEHICPLPCSKTLSCGRHKCQERCHMGRCSPCWQSSFEELYCECGAEVIYPPVSCGTRRPVCNRPCSREHPCDHEVLHNCHSEPACPPCGVLTQRWCHGKHELRKAVPCHVKEISCGLPCNKPLLCGRHKCITMCHAGSCERPGQQCMQPCIITREMCGHICAAPCHEGKCPDTPCKEMVKVTCQCGHRTMSRVCADNAREYQRIASNILASKMADMQLGHSVDLEEVFGQGAKKQNQLKTLECNDECKTIERNRRLALGLQIVNPDLSGKLMPRYTDYMKQWAKKDSHFCQMVHDKLTELVQLAKTSKQKSRSYSFDVMNREKRHFVHESCQHFGCESQAYDEEPKRNVVATAVKDKCWLPSYSLLEVIQREKGQRKVPGPVLNASKGNNSTKTVLSLPVKQSQKSISSSSTTKTPDKEIDYFDYQG
ncbi:protein shuttle craft [Nylanderia fulva]|uniref:protein shuttle craft n=1 Tax=Nylanderia fulva TaxID=613905 RepID=UPI0010FB95AF|nr:protein shuttle craft [Nylanderia fulva]